MSEFLKEKIIIQAFIIIELSLSSTSNKKPGLIMKGMKLVDITEYGTQREPAAESHSCRISLNALWILALVEKLSCH